jgi:hypothetical protein
MQIPQKNPIALPQINNNQLLALSLSAAVPLKIMEFVRQGGPTQEDWDTLQERLTPILERADETLLYRGRKTKPGEVAAAHNELARGLAIMSFIPGGVTFAGEHYLAENYDWARGREAQRSSPEK